VSSWLSVLLVIFFAIGLAAMSKGRVTIPQVHGPAAKILVGIALGLLAAPILAFAAIRIALALA
jgi:hypothetical protein